MAKHITTFLMFDGKAEEAINFYVSLFGDSAVTSIRRYETGKIMHATFTLKGQAFMASDSSARHDFSFTPASSFYVECESEAEIETLFARLSAEGKVFMHLGKYGFSKKFGWVNDRFGVSWQLNLPG